MFLSACAIYTDTKCTIGGGCVVVTLPQSGDIRELGCCECSNSMASSHLVYKHRFRENQRMRDTNNKISTQAQIILTF